LLWDRTTTTPWNMLSYDSSRCRASWDVCLRCRQSSRCVHWLYGATGVLQKVSRSNIRLSWNDANVRDSGSALISQLCCRLLRYNDFGQILAWQITYFQPHRRIVVSKATSREISGVWRRDAWGELGSWHVSLAAKWSRFGHSDLSGPIIPVQPYLPKHWSSRRTLETAPVRRIDHRPAPLCSPRCSSHSLKLGLIRQRWYTHAAHGQVSLPSSSGASPHSTSTRSSSEAVGLQTRFVGCEALPSKCATLK